MPPKKDAFADLFSSASGSKPKPSLNQQQHAGNLNLPLNSKAIPNGQNAWSDLDLLSRSNSSSNIGRSGSAPPNNGSVGSVPTSRHASPALADPFSIFDKPTPPQQQQQRQMTPDPWDDFGTNSNTQSKPAAASAAAPRPTGGATNGMSLLDDDFTDAFVEETKPAPSPAPSPAPPKPNPRPAQRADSSRPSRASSSSPAPASREKSGARDQVLAELVDIGFPVDVSNRAIDSVGPDVQRCVNFIMEGGNASKSKPQHNNNNNNNTQSASMSSAEAKFNDISSEIFSKASFFLAKGRETVLKNIEQFQQKPDPSRPAWMKNQEKYSSWLVDGEDSEQQRQRLDVPRERKQGSNNSSDNESRSSSDNSSARNGARGRDERGNAPSMPTSSRRRPAKATPAPSQDQDNFRSSSPAKFTDSQTSSFSKPPSKSSSALPTPSKSPQPPAEEFDLLGLNKRETQRLDQFLQTDYDKFNTLAASSFTNGDYDLALVNYKKCLEILPETFDERIVILSNLALISTKIGNYKQAKSYCDSGLVMISEDKITDANWKIKDKVIKTWYLKLLSRKAESLEMLELFPEALTAYLLLIKYGVTEKKVMDGKRRVDNIVNPKKPAPPKPSSTQSKPRAPATSGASVTRAPVSTAASEKAKMVSEQFAKQKQEEDDKFRLHEKVHEKLTSWSSGKEDNLRTLLVGLPDIIPNHLGFSFLTKKITINDIMLPKKVKINYMKVISAIHPDKLGKLETEDKMICQSVFVVLNNAWDSFREKEL